MNLRNGFKKALLSVAGLISALVLVEAGLRIFFAFHVNHDIEMWRYATHLKVAVDDERSHVHAPNRQGRFMNVDIQINSKGLRDKEYPYQKANNSYRILCLGNSITLGWGVPLADTFVKRIEAGLNRDPGLKYEVINFGVGNYNLAQEIESFRREGSKYAADAVMIFYHPRDAQPSQKVAPTFLSTHSYLYAFLLQRWSQLRPYWHPELRYIPYYLSFYQGRPLEEIRTQLEHFNNELKKQKARLIVVILPELRNLESYPFSTYHKTMADLLTKQGIEHIDLENTFHGKHSIDVIVARGDPHPNVEGHRLISEQVLQDLKDMKLLNEK